MYFYKPHSIRKVRREGFNFQLDISMFLDHAIFFCRMDEDPSLNVLLQQLKKNFIVLDVGANIGYLTLKFARTCSDGYVYSFEPDSQNYQALRTNIELNRLNNVTTIKKALGAQDGQEILYKYFPGNPGTNRILPEKPNVKHQLECVEVIPLDKFVEQEKISRIDLIKIDVEGYEIFTLKGAQQLIKKWNPILFVELVEVNQNQQGYTCLSLVEYIESMGYEVLDASTMKLVDRTKKNYNTDILCFKNRPSLS